MRISFYTLGCKANQYDTQAMAAALTQAGHEVVPFSDVADVVVINSCTVTAESDRKTRQAIGKAKAASPHAAVVVAGCYAQRDAEKLLAMEHVDGVAGTSNRRDIVRVVEQAVAGGKINAVQVITDVYEEAPPLMNERIRAHIKIQDGCDRYCTYCIIPYTRGPLRSRSVEGIANDARQAAEQGCREVVLTGIRLTSYAKERGGSLMDAVEAAASVEGVQRVRLGSLDPDEIDGAFIARAAACAKLCRHFHLSLQSGCDSVLKRMNRRYTSAQYHGIMEAIREAMPDASFTTDVMTGFVGETQDEFEQTVAFVRDAGFARIHVFPYSVREGTAAARMKGHLPKAVKTERAHALGEVGKELEAAYVQRMVGQTLEIIPEPAESGKAFGYARNYVRVCIEAGEDTGEVVAVRITGSQGGVALGERVEE